MKISKQERIIIIVLLVLAVLGVGFFVFIMPNINKIDTNNKNLQSKQTEYEELVTKLEHEKTIDDEIKTAYEEGKNLANTFYDDLTTYEADEIMRKFLAKGKDITIDGLSISPMSTSTLSVSIFAQNEVTYPLKDFANTVVTNNEPEMPDIKSMNTRQQVMYAKDLMATVLALSENVTVGSTTVSFNIYSDKLENLHNFVDLLYEGVYDDTILDAEGKPQRKATYISAVTYELPDKAGTPTDNNESATEGENENNAETSTQENNDSKKDGYVMQLSVQLFSIKPVADPFAQQTNAE